MLPLSAFLLWLPISQFSPRNSCSRSGVLRGGWGEMRAVFIHWPRLAIMRMALLDGMMAADSVELAWDTRRELDLAGFRKLIGTHKAAQTLIFLSRRDQTPTLCGRRWPLRRPSAAQRMRVPSRRLGTRIDPAENLPTHLDFLPARLPHPRPLDRPLRGRPQPLSRQRPKPPSPTFARKN